jgi:hypothetical protein
MIPAADGSSEETSMTTRLAAFAALLLVLLSAPPARATNCQTWGRLGPAQKRATVDRMIQDALAGSGGRSYRVDRAAVSRCLERSAQSIQYDFDSACADSRTAGMQALNGIFKDYLWSCVQ